MNEYMNSNNANKYLWKNTFPIKTWIVVAALSAILTACWPDSKKLPVGQDQKIIVDTTKTVDLHKQKLHRVLQDTLEFKDCLSYDDLLYALEVKKHITTIDPEAIFEKDSAFFAKAKITKEYFLQAYYDSNIIRDAIYTKKFHKTINDKSMAILQEKLLSKTWYAKYIHKDINIPVIDNIVNSIQKRDAIKSKKKKKSIVKIENDIARNNNLVEPWKYGRREAYTILEQHNIWVRSSKKQNAEKWNNKSTGRTCLHNINKKTINMLWFLAHDMSRVFTDDVYTIYKPITVTWWTEYGHAVSEKFPSLTHWWWAKTDIAITLLTALYFHEKWVSNYQVKTDETPSFKAIPCTIWDMPVKVIAHDKHFDILVE